MKASILTAGLVLAAAISLPAAAGVGSLAEVTVFDRTDGRVLSVHRHEGRYYVVGKPGNEYQIRITNRTGADVLNVISVDGVNAVSGETAAWDQTGYVLGGGTTFDVKGWRKSLNRIAAFYFTELPDSYAARTGRPDNVGAIGIAVFRRKPEPPPPAILREHSRRDAPAPAARAAAESEAPGEGAADSAERQRGTKAESRIGTGHGRSETSVVRHTRFERASPTPDEVITIYYDTYRNLVAQGVIRERPRYAHPAPNPFPGSFVPDPR